MRHCGQFEPSQYERGFGSRAFWGGYIARGAPSRYIEVSQLELVLEASNSYSIHFINKRERTPGQVPPFMTLIHVLSQTTIR